ncbi:uncharacterized protein IUM83_10099 [Phytophthora cinnamomi]|uniref:uncharacterized protein n=1 Tax=Phytophthora cinnamomi TaxID=4785 RepID=UPI00355A1D6B|nr:hypothetical protein IUM83_10099 [Phytophthora cinnamomi]
MEALYERVLAHVPTPQLHESYNAVLHEEYASVSQSLGDVLAAFAKLQEVRDAVSKLQQQSHEASAGGCSSDSVRASADELVELQRQLQRQAERLALGMEVAMVERKRKRVDAVVASVATSLRSSGGGGDGRGVAAKKAKRLEADGAESSGEEDEVTSSAQIASCEDLGWTSVAQRELATTSGIEARSSSEAERGNDEDESGESGNEVEGSEAAWKVLMNQGGLTASLPETQTTPSAAQETERDVAKAAAKSTAKTKPSKNTATYLKTILEVLNDFSSLDRSFIIPEVVAMLKESVEDDVGYEQQNEVASCLEIFLCWGDGRTGYHVQHVGLYREYAAVVGSYVDRLPLSKQTFELESLKENLSSTIEELDGCSIPETKEAGIAAAARDARNRSHFLGSIEGADTVPHERRIERLLRLLVAFKKETVAGVNNSFRDRMIKIIGITSRWLSEDFRDPVQLLAHRMVVNAFRAILNRIPKASTRRHVARLLKRMSTGISNPASSKSKACNRAAQVLRNVEKYERKHISPTQAHQLTEAVRILMTDVTVGWNPSRDMRMRKCVQTLKNILVQAQVQAGSDLKSRRNFETCFAEAVKWKVEDPPAVVTVERMRKHVDEDATTTSSAVTIVRNNGGEGSGCSGAAKKARRLKANADAGSSCERSSEVGEMKSSAQMATSEDLGSNSVTKRELAAVSDSESRSSSESDSAGVEDESGESDDEVEGGEAAWKTLTTQAGITALSETKTAQSSARDTQRSEAEATTTTKALKKTATYLKAILEVLNYFSSLDRSFIIPELLAVLKESVEEDVGGVQHSDVASCLKILVSWGDSQRGYDVQYVSLYREYAAVMESYVDRLPLSRQTFELESLKEALTLMVEDLDGSLMPEKNKAVIASSVQDAKKRKSFSEAIGVTPTVAHEGRIETLLRVLVAFKKETETTALVSRHLRDRMMNVIVKTSRWLNEDFRDPVRLLAHRMVVDAFRGFLNRIPKISARDHIALVLKNVSEGISDPSNARIRGQLARLHNRAAKVFCDVKQYSGKRILPKEAYQLTKALKDILVRAQIHAGSDLKSRKSFEECFAHALKWEVEDPPAVVKAPTK